MAEPANEWANLKRENIFGYPVNVQQMQFKAGAAGAVYGSLLSGALTTTFML